MDVKSPDETVVQAAFIIPPKAYLLDVAGPIQIFYEAACHGAPLKLLYGAIFPEQTECASSCTLSFNGLLPYDQLNLNKGDYLFVPGMDYALISTPRFLMESRPFQHWLTVQHQKGVIICCVCTGVFLLASAGLLDGRACTTHWEFAERLKSSYPKIRLQTNRLFVYDDDIYTSAGIVSSIDLALFLIDRLRGGHFAAKIAKEAVVYFRRSINDPQLSVFMQYRNHLDHRIHKVQDILAQSLAHPLTIDEIAAQVNMSGRNLTRLFKKTTFVTIGAYVDQLRAELAERLIGEGHTMQATALHCGLKSASQLHHLLNRYRPVKNSA